ncbi:MAG: thioredoxin family protein [Spirochaeta sp.]|jgi:hypothetical protein|nr:thioredoxin family protein [Spirochaeta sp.]
MYYADLAQVWPTGIAAPDYFSSLKYYRNMVESLYRKAVVDDADAKRVSDALAAHPAVNGRTDAVRALVVTEDWCGDSAVTLPYVTRLCETIGVPLRIFRQSEAQELKKWYVDNGTEHIPVVSMLFAPEESDAADASIPIELFRWVERPAAAHDKVSEWVAAHPEFPELRSRKDTDEAASREYFRLYAKLLRDMAGWYRDGLWREIAVEFQQNLQTG